MNVKAVVKVMNFHALLRVEASKNLAQKYQAVSDELEHMMSIITSNRNLQKDKKIKMPNPNLPALKIYLGSDYGFCGGVNTAISSKISQDSSSDKVIVGKKVKPGKTYRLYMTQEEFTMKFQEVKEILEEAVKEQKWSEIYICYNHFFNLSKIAPIEKKIYPLESNENEMNREEWTDFVIEGNVEELLQELIISYLIYQVKIASASAYASENTVRQSATTESLKKIDEMEEKELQLQRKVKNQKEFQKTIDSSVKQKALKGR